MFGKFRSVGQWNPFRCLIHKEETLSLHKPARSALPLYLLEPRMMFDGAVVVSAGADAALKSIESMAKSPVRETAAPAEIRAAQPEQNNGKKEVAFVDSSIADWQKVVAGIAAGVEIELLDGQQSGLAQIAKWAATHKEYDGLHLVSHGAEAALKVGSDYLTQSSLSYSTIQSELAQIGSAVHAGGDLLLYGCDIGKGAAGSAFLNALAQATQTDVAASVDATGATLQSGNWSLEAHSGTIEVSSLAIADYPHALSLFEPFANQTDYPVGQTPISAIGKDVNGDGKLDILVSNITSQSVSVLLNKGDGTFAASVEYPVAGGAFVIISEDFNGDNKADILTGNLGENPISLLLNNGDGTFTSATINAAFPVLATADSSIEAISIAGSVRCLDYNKDGKLDILYSSVVSVGVSVLYGNGDGTFQPQVDYQFITEASGLPPVFLFTSADFNKDNKEDFILTSTLTDIVAVLMNKGDGTFAYEIIQLEQGSMPFAISCADVNGDGYADAVVSNVMKSTVSVLINNGSGSFLPRVDYATLAMPYRISVLDVNGDNKVDLMVGNYAGSIGPYSVLLNNGDGTFANRTDLLSTDSLFSSSADMNGDGKSDLLFTNVSSNSVSVIQNQFIIHANLTLSASAANPTFISGGSPVSLFTAADADTQDSGQRFTGLEINVTNICDQTELLTVGGTEIALTGDNTVPLAGGGSAEVKLSLNSATNVVSAVVTVTGLSLDNAAMNALINGMTYTNSSASLTEVDRLVSLTQIADSGSTDNVLTANIASTVKIKAGAKISGVVVANGSRFFNTAYGTGDTINVTVDFNKEVIVVGTPVLALDVGGNVKNATYVSGSGGRSLVFAYVVQAGDVDTYGVRVIANGITLASGVTIKDYADPTMNATLFHESVLSSTAKVDTLAPTAGTPVISDFTLPSGSNFTFKVTYADVGIGLNSATFAPGNVTVKGPSPSTTALTVTSAAKSGNVVTYTVTAPGGSWDASDAGSYTISINGGSVKDQVGNAVAAVPSAKTFNVLVNAAPVLDASKTPVFASVPQNQSAAPTSGTSGATLLSSLVSKTGIANFSDTTASDPVGMAIVASNNSNGSWYYSSNNGSSWSQMGALSASSSLLLSANSSTWIYYKNNGTYVGTITDALTFRAWDGNSGVAGNLVNTSSNGGTTAFSSATDTVAVTVTPPPPSITSATYDNNTGVLLVTAANMSTGDTIVASKLSLSGEGGTSYTLTTSNVTASNATTFSLTLNAADRAAINPNFNKSGSSSTSGTAYNLSAASGWDASATTAPADATNSVTATVPVPTISSATYDAATGTLLVSASNLLKLSGANNDIAVNKLSVLAEGVTYTLSSANVEISSSSAFTVTLNATDKAALNQIVNKNGSASVNAVAYNLAAAEDWANGAAAAVTVADLTANAVTVSNVAVPTILSATYDASSGILAVTGSGLLQKSGAANDIDVSKLSLFGEGISYTLTSGSVEISSASSFSVTLNATDKAQVNTFINRDGSASTDTVAYNLAAAEDWARGADSAVVVVDSTGNGVTASNVAIPSITSATYDASTGSLVVTGSALSRKAGSNNDIDATQFSITGEGGEIYTLTDTASVEITSGSSFTLLLSATDKAAVNMIINKNGSSSTGGGIYNLAAAEDWNRGAVASVTIADLTANALTASNVAIPTITSATYDRSTGILLVTGTGFFKLNGTDNDIVVSKLELRGGNDTTRVLSYSSNVEILSATSFMVTLHSTDMQAVNSLLNKAGTSSAIGITYNVAAREDWAAGASATDADLSNNGITVSMGPVITSANYDAASGTLVVTGTSFLAKDGALNDIDARKLTIGVSPMGGSFTLTSNTPNVEISSATSFTVLLGTTDRAAVNQLLNTNGLSSASGTYNLAAANGWNTRVVGNADLTGNPINATVAPNISPTFTSSDNTLTLSANSNLNSLNTLLAVNDANINQVLTWSQFLAPSHGRLNLQEGALTTTSGSTALIPAAGISYTPNAGYAGTDSFTVYVSDGSATINKTITVTVTPVAPSLPTLDAETDSGVVGDNKSKANILKFSGSGAAYGAGSADGSDVIVFLDMNNNGTFEAGTDRSGTVAANSTGSWSGAAVDVTGLADGDYKFYAFDRALIGAVVGPVSAYRTITIDRTAPLLLTVTPVNNATAISPTTSTLTVGFNETMQKGTGNFILRDVTANSDVATIAATSSNISGWGSNSVTISHGATLVGAHTYSLRIEPTAIQDNAGNSFAGINNDLLASFTTSNTIPTFSGGATAFSVNQNGAAFDLTSNLHISDVDTLQTLTLSQAVAPSQGGTLVFSNATLVSGGSDLAPAAGSVTYRPNAGFYGTETFSVGVSDGSNSSSRSFTVTVNGAATLSASNTHGSYSEQDSPTLIDSAIVLTTPNSNSYDCWNGATLKVQVSNNAFSADSLSLPSSNTGAVWNDGGTIRFDTTAIATMVSAPYVAANNGASLTFTFNSDATTAMVQSLARSLLFADTATDPTAGARTITFTVTEAGIPVTASRIIDFNVKNDAPVLTVTAVSNPSYSERSSNAASLFSAASVESIEVGQKIRELELTVGTLADAANEILLVDGSSLALSNGNGITTSNGFSASVTVANGLATVLISKGGDIALADAQTLITGLGYKNLSVDPHTAGGRTVTITRIQDTGGTIVGSDTALVSLPSATIAIIPVNNAPTLTTTVATPTYYEAGAAVTLFSAATLNTVEAGQQLQQLTLTVSGLVNGANEILLVDGSNVLLSNGNSGTTSGGKAIGYSVAVSNSTATVTLSKADSLSNWQSVINTLAYKNSATGLSTGSTRSVTLTSLQDAGGVSNGGSDTSTLSQSATVTLATINHAPTLTTTSSNPSFTEKGSAVAPFTGTAIGLGSIDSEQKIVQIVLTVSNVSDGSSEQLTVDGSVVALTHNNSVSTASGSYTASVKLNSTTATITISKLGDFTTAAAQTLLDGLRYQNSSSNPTAGNRLLTLTTLKDSGGTANNGTDTATLNNVSTITVLAVNDAPTLTALAATPTYIENGAAVTLFSNAALQTGEAGQLIRQAVVTVSGLQNGANELLLVDGSQIALSHGTSGTTSGGNGIGYTVSVSNNTATITLSKEESTSNWQSFMNGLSYKNSATGLLAAATRTVTLSSVQDSGGVSNGGVDSSTPNIAATVTLATINHAPTVTSSSANPTFTEKGSAVTLFSASAISLGSIDSGQMLTQLLLTVSNIQDGSNEQLTIDGSSVALSNNTLVTTSGNSFVAAVSRSGTTATITVTRSGHFTAQQAQNLLDGISYQNNSVDPSAGNRVVTLSSLQDNGGTADGGSDSATLNLASTVTLIAVNDAPTLSVNASNPTFVESQSDSALLFSDAAISAVEAGQNIQQMILTVSGLLHGVNEILVVDGSEVILSNGVTGTSVGGNAIAYSVSVTQGTATVTLSKSASAEQWQNYVNTLGYKNNSTGLTADSRTITLTSIQDSGGGSTASNSVNSSSVLTLASNNNPPTLSTVAEVAATFTEKGAAALLFSSTTIDVGAGVFDVGQYISNIVLTVSNLSDGNDEILLVDGDALALSHNNSVTTTSNGYLATVQLSGATATVIISKAGNFTESQAQILVDNLAYKNTSPDPHLTSSRVVTLTSLKDSGGGNDSTALQEAATVSIIPVNDAPTLQATAASPTYYEGDVAVAPFSGVTVSPVETGQQITGISLSVSALAHGGNEILVLDGTEISLTDGTSGTSTGAYGIAYTVSVSGTTATVILSKTDTAAHWQSILTSLSYKNSSSNLLAATRGLTLTWIGDDGGVAGGGDDDSILTASSTITLATYNHAPTLSANALNPTFSEEGSAVQLFSNTSISQGSIDSGQKMVQLQLTVTQLSDGGDEILLVDGSTLALTDNNTITTANNAFTAVVTVTGSTATVTISKAGNFTEAQAQTLVDALSYKNLSNDPHAATNRTVTLTGLRDSGGTLHNGSDSVILNNASTITLLAVNDPPTVTATTATPRFIEASSAGVSLFSNAAINTVEAGQQLQQVVLTVSNLGNGSDELLLLDSTAIVLSNGVTGTSSGGNAIAFAVSVTGATATVTLSKSDTVAHWQEYINSLAYKNSFSGGNLHTGSRTVTLTALSDSGGGTDTSSGLQLASTVTVDAINHAPTLTSTATTVEFLEKGSPVAPFSATAVDLGGATDANQAISQIVLALSNTHDGDNLIIDDKTIVLFNGLAYATRNGYFVSVSIGSDDVSLITITKSGNFSAAAAQTLVNGIQYMDVGGNLDTADRQLAVALIKDSGGTSNGGSNQSTPTAATATIHVYAVNDAPAFTALNSTSTYIEAATNAVSLFANSSISPVEWDQRIIQAVVTVSDLVSGSEEMLLIDGSLVPLIPTSSLQSTSGHAIGYSVAVNGSTATVTLSKGDSTSNWQEYVNAIGYKNSIVGPITGSTRTISVAITDNGGVAHGGVDTSTLGTPTVVTLAAINHAPTLNATSLSPTFTEKASAQTLFSNSSIDLGIRESTQRIALIELTVSNVSDGSNELLHIDGSAVQLVDGNALATANGFVAVHSVGNTATVTITKSGDFSQTEAEELLNGLSYQNDDVDPESNLQREITLTYLQDSGGVANGGSDATELHIVSTVTLSAVNDAPIIAVPSSRLYQDNALHAISGVVVSDVDAGSGIMTASLTVNNGIVHLDVSDVIMSAGANDSAMLSISGSLSQINAALATLAYATTRSSTGSDILQLTVEDGGNTGSGGVQSDTQTIAISLTGNDTPTVAVPAGLTIADKLPIAISGLAVADSTHAETFSLTLSTDNGGVLHVDASNVTISSGNNDSTALTLTGSLSAINAALATVEYSATSDSASQESITLLVSDGYSEGIGGAKSSSNSLTFSLTANDTPQVNVAAVNALPIMDTLFHPIPGITISDTLSGESVTATVSVLQGIVHATAQGNAILLNNDSSVLTLSGTVTDVNSTLASLEYASTASASGLETVTLSLNDNGTYRFGGAKSSSNSFSFDLVENGQPAWSLPDTSRFSDTLWHRMSGISVSDSDAQVLTITLSDLHGALRVTASAGATIDSGNGSNSVQFHGSLSAINATLATLDYQTEVSATGTETIHLLVDDGNDTAIGGSKSNSAHFQVEMVGNDSPVVLAPQDTVIVGDNRQYSVSGFAFTDEFSAELLEATLVAEQGVLHLTASGSAVVTDNDSTEVRVRGSKEDLNHTLALFGYTPLGVIQKDTIIVAVNDNNSIAVGGAKSSAAQLSVAPIANDTPLLKLPLNQTFVYSKPDQLNPILDADFSDTYSNAVITATLSVEHGIISIHPNAQLEIIGNASELVTFSGAVQEIKAALRDFYYVTNLQTSGIDRVSVTINDNNSNGLGGAKVASNTILVNVLFLPPKIPAAPAAPPPSEPPPPAPPPPAPVLTFAGQAGLPSMGDSHVAPMVTMNGPGALSTIPAESRPNPVQPKEVSNNQAVSQLNLPALLPATQQAPQLAPAGNAVPARTV
ncbi:DUF4347 domain-containing protein, partial [Candidatus Magnetaquicoccus inordinatus]|uniref:DUF4347 domain-containing protein n=1 Tax=Candidatus Magnetaquicoccus inordinatus TaxID=2496818 RepID=UPI00187D6808